MSKQYPEVVCDCQLPDNCTLEVDIEFGKQKEFYQQGYFNKNFYHIIDFNGMNSILIAEYRDYTHFFKYGKGKDDFLPELSVPLKVITKSKGCVSGNSDCPIGNVYGDISNGFSNSINKISHSNVESEVRNTFIGKVTPQDKLDIPLVYTKQFCDFGIEEMNPFTALVELFAGYSSDDLKYVQKYTLSVAECGHKPFVPKWYNASVESNMLINTGAFIYHHFGNRSLFNTSFNLILQRKVNVQLTISFNEKTTGQNDVDRRKATAENNQALGKNNPKKDKGWTKSGTELITTSIKFEGSITKLLGMDSKKWSAELKHEYSKLKDKKELSVIEKVNKVVDNLNRLLSSAPDKKRSKYKQEEYELSKFELVYPVIKISGEREVALNKQNEIVPKCDFYMRGDPFFGFKLTFDMIQAFAAYYGINTIVSVIREQGTKNEEDVQKGKDGAFLGVQLDIIFDLSLACGVKYKTDDTGELKFDEASSAVNLAFGISCETNIRAGFRYYGVSGFFKAEAKVDAIFCAGWASDGSGDIVFYHDGIKAYASVEYGVGIAKEETQKNKGFPGKKTVTFEVKESTKPLDEEWIIHEPLPKDKSPHRWSPIPVDE